MFRSTRTFICKPTLMHAKYINVHRTSTKTSVSQRISSISMYLKYFNVSQIFQCVSNISMCLKYIHVSPVYQCIPKYIHVSQIYQCISSISMYINQHPSLHSSRHYIPIHYIPPGVNVIHTFVLIF